ncbi:Protein CBG09009 [Caenorhabditis briggsae]|uniref:Protein CBG09009 n=1 Tax=Caenorhabditis briggsae TaxID=6238 RepID=A8X809_CAEBR|nr:Protein CBG09009 [Caenorhabditis briggsae]CAP28770.1 Protein CBG09009 [Caenorhabditis briggsae]
MSFSSPDPFGECPGYYLPDFDPFKKCRNISHFCEHAKDVYDIEMLLRWAIFVIPCCLCFFALLLNIYIFWVLIPSLRKMNDRAKKKYVFILSRAISSTMSTISIFLLPTMIFLTHFNFWVIAFFIIFEMLSFLSFLGGIAGTTLTIYVAVVHPVYYQREMSLRKCVTILLVFWSCAVIVATIEGVISEGQLGRISAENSGYNSFHSGVQRLLFGELENLRILRISELRNFSISESENFGTSESENFRIISESENFGTSESENFRMLEFQNFEISVFRNLRISELQSLRISEFDKFFISFTGIEIYELKAASVRGRFIRAFTVGCGIVEAAFVGKYTPFLCDYSSCAEPLIIFLVVCISIAFILCLGTQFFVIFSLWRHERKSKKRGDYSSHQKAMTGVKKKLFGGFFVFGTMAIFEIASAIMLVNSVGSQDQDSDACDMLESSGSRLQFVISCVILTLLWTIGLFFDPIFTLTFDPLFSETVTRHYSIMKSRISRRQRKEEKTVISDS